MLSRFVFLSSHSIPVLVLLLGSGCGSLAAVTSGHIGCPEHEIQIFNKKTGWSSTNWSARCRGRVYHCYGASGGKGAPHISCKQERAASSRVALGSTTTRRGLGCRYDTQCKGVRICQRGRCVYPARQTPAVRATSRPATQPPPDAPASTARAAASAFERQLGIRIGNASRYSGALGLSASTGAVILSVTPGGAAKRRNLARGDVIRQLASVRIRFVSDVHRVSRSLKLGQRFSLVIQRKDRVYTFHMKY